MTIMSLYLSFLLLFNSLVVSSALLDTSIEAVAYHDCKSKQILVQVASTGSIQWQSASARLFTQDGSISIAKSDFGSDKSGWSEIAFPFTNHLNGKELACDVSVNIHTIGNVIVPCTIIQQNDCRNNDELDLNESISKNISRDLQEEVDVFYNVTVRSYYNCETLRGTVSAIVRKSNGRAVRNKRVNFLLLGEETNTQYTETVVTNGRGRSIFRFTLLPIDLNTQLWCSIAIPNPALPFAQNVACSMNFQC